MVLFCIETTLNFNPRNLGSLVCVCGGGGGRACVCEGVDV